MLFCGLAQVGVGVIEPDLPDGAEVVEYQGRLRRNNAMRDIRVQLRVSTAGARFASLATSVDASQDIPASGLSLLMGRWPAERVRPYRPDMEKCFG
jgi:hypothetical protein